MKKIIFLLSIVLAPIAIQAQPGLDSVYQTIPTKPNDMHAMVVDDDTLVIVQSLFDTLNNEWGINLIKLDTLGNVLFSNLLTDTLGYSYIPSMWGNKLISTNDGGYAYGASYVENPTCFNCGFLAKYHHNGEIDFVKHYQRPDTTDVYFSVENLLQLEDGGYLLLSHYVDTSSAEWFSPYLIRTDADGNELWSQDFAVGEDTASIFTDVISLSSSKFVVTGFKFFLTASYEIEYTKPITFLMDSLGNVIHQVVGDMDSIEIWKILPTNDGGFIQALVKRIYPSSAAYQLESVAGIRKLDSNFVVQWTWYTDNEDFKALMGYTSLLKTPDGNYVASGSRYTHNSIVRPAIHVKISPEGEVIWERFDSSHYGDAVGYRNAPTATGVLSSGSTVSIGSTEIAEPNYDSEKGWLLKISPGGCVYEWELDSTDCWAGATVVSTTETSQTAAEIQVYPNPAEDELTIVLPNDRYTNAQIYFYDVTGRFLRKQSLSTRHNMLNINKLPKGMLFYTILSEKGILMNGKLVKE